ncbi:MAG TPA: alpha/beta hydrolase [Steroidobacteraceae bacterium]
MLAVIAGCGFTHPPAGGAPGATASVPTAATQFTASADGVAIAWRQYGRGEPAIVLIHGWATNSSIWREQLAPLARQHSVVTVDLGGAGASGTNRQTWSLANFAQDVAAVARRLPQARIILVGDGLGGPIALEAAPLIGARVAGIIGTETFRTIGQPALLPSQLQQYLQPFRSDFAAATRQFVIRTLFRARADPALVRGVADLAAHSAPDRGLATLTELNQLDYAAILPAVKVPIVVIDSDLGGAVDEARLRKAVPQLRLITLNGDDSFPMLDDAERFNTTLLQAIDSLVAQSDHSARP